MFQSISSNKKAVALFVMGVLVPVLFLVILGSSRSSTTKGYDEYKIVPAPIPQQVTFAGEEMPLDNFDVRERLDRELLANKFRHSATLLYLKRSARYFPIIEPILKRYGVPDDFKYLCVAESGLANEISPAKAVGYWQFIESAAKRYGLRITDEIDERYDVEKSTEAAAKYLLESYKKFGSWALAAASYNAGVAGISNRVNDQGEDNYYDLHMVEETLRYMPRIISLKIIMKNPEDYGFVLSDEDYYKPIKTKSVRVSGKVDSWVSFAKEHKTTYRLLRVLNPWIRSDKLVNKEQATYNVKIYNE